MSESLEYTEKEAKQEEAAYRTPSMAARRRLVRDHLDLRAGEDVLSVGCGPGFEPAELAESVEPAGTVYGIDRSEAMLTLAERRCGDVPNVALANAEATDLPLDDESVDAVAAVQIYEYVEDLDAALDELHRVLRPGGRAIPTSTPSSGGRPTANERNACSTPSTAIARGRISAHDSAGTSERRG